MANTLECAPILRNIAIILSYFVGTVLLGAVLAPPLFWAAHPLFEAGYLPFLKELEFQKVFNRAILVAAIALIWPTIRSLNIRSLDQFGLAPNPRRWKDLAFGFSASFLTMVALGTFLVVFGIYRMKGTLPLDRLPGVAVTAVVVSVLEELLFRGAILGIFRQALGKVSSILGVSALFSVLHFLRAKEEVIPAESVNWLSGFGLIPHMFWRFQEPMLVLAGFTTLFLVGVILAYATLETRSLYIAIGLHAGWIFGESGFSKLTKRVIKNTLPWFGQDLTVGLGSVFVVALTGAIVWWWVKRPRISTDRDTPNSV